MASKAGSPAEKRAQAAGASDPADTAARCVGVHQREAVPPAAVEGKVKSTISHISMLNGRSKAEDHTNQCCDLRCLAPAFRGRCDTRSQIERARSRSSPPGIAPTGRAVELVR